MVNKISAFSKIIKKAAKRSKSKKEDDEINEVLQYLKYILPEEEVIDSNLDVLQQAIMYINDLKEVITDDVAMETQVKYPLALWNTNNTNNN